ncbi:MAG: ParB N-terminal domain-containing protein, partial [Fimbriimonadales bacterium]
MPKSTWPNRITRYAEVPVSNLTANPRNPRRHPSRQLEALRASLRSLGFVAPVIVNERTGYLIDGHA